MVAGWFRQFLIMSGKKREIGGVGWLRGIIQKQGVGFPEMEKQRFGGPQHLNPHTDRLGLYRTRAASLVAPQGEGCVHIRGDLGVMIPR